MDDEGYTSPADFNDEVKTDTSALNRGTFVADSSEILKLRHCWEDLRISINKSTNEEKEDKFFVTDNKPTISNEILKSLWILNDSTLKSVDFGPGSSPSSVSVIKSSIEPIITINLDEFIGNLLHLICGRESRSFVFSDQEQYFFKRNPYIIIGGLSPTLLDNFSQIFIQCGYKYVRLKRFISFVEEKGRSELMLISFEKALSDYLDIYRSILYLVTKDSFRTLIQLEMFIQPLQLQLMILDEISSVAIKDSPIAVLSRLAEMLLTENAASIIDLVQPLFVAMSSIYFRYISDWIFRGELGPPSEFHVKKEMGVIFKDRRFWTKQFVQSYEETPIFIADSADLILETGKGVYFLNLIRHMQQYSIYSSVFNSHASDSITPCLSFMAFQKLKSEWKYKQEKFFEENAFLLKEVQASVQELIASSKTLNLDLVSIGLIRASYTIEAGKQKRSVSATRPTELQLTRIQSKSVRRSQSFASGQTTWENVSKPYLTPQVDHNRSRIVSRKRNFNKRAERTIEEILAFKLDSNDNNNVSLEEENDDGERLNPEKFIVTEMSPVTDFELHVFNEKPSRVCFVNTNEPSKLDDEINKCDDDTTLTRLFSESLKIPLVSQNKMVNSVLVHYFICQEKLLDHLSTLNDFLFLQNGIFSHTLSNLLLQEMKIRPANNVEQLIKNTGTLNTILSETLLVTFLDQDQNPLTNNLSFALVHEKDVFVKELLVESIESGKYTPYISSEYLMLSALRLNYSIGWPLNIILTDELLHHYETLFGILIQLTRSEQLLEDAFICTKSKCSKSKQLKILQIYRRELHHFVSSLRFYFGGVVIKTKWEQFCSNIQKMDTLEKIYDHIVRYVREVTAECFLVGSSRIGIIKLMLRHLTICDSFCAQLVRICKSDPKNWDDKTFEISEKEFNQLKKKYKASDAFRKLFMNTLYKASEKCAIPKIENFLNLFNFNGYYTCSESIHSSIEKK